MTLQDVLITGDLESKNCVIFTHGAGAAMDTPFMNYFADGMTIKDWHVIRFNFPYMEQMKQTGKRRPPNTQKILLETWSEMIHQFKPKGKLIIAGKSMGGRMASIHLNEQVNDADGLVVFGYPFHPPSKPEKLRTEHLQEFTTPALILQGDRDTLGNKMEVASYPLSKKINIEWLTDGDHSFKPRKKSGYTEQQNWQQALQKVNSFQVELERK